MYTGRTVFSQVMDFLPMDEFRKCVTRYDGDHKLKSFSCLDHFLTLAFAQLSDRQSLRDIETCLRAMQPRLYHMGFAALCHATIFPMPMSIEIGVSMPISRKQ